MATIEKMMRKAHLFEGMTLAQIKQLVKNHPHVDTNLATAKARQIEEQFLSEEDRETRIAVFLSGLMANLVDE